MVVLIFEDGMNYDLLITEKICVADSFLSEDGMNYDLMIAETYFASDRFPLSLPQ